MPHTETEALKGAVAALTTELIALRQTLEEIKSELCWANSRGPSYTVTDPAIAPDGESPF